MTFTPIPFGEANWDVPVNNAFTDQDTRITQNGVDIANNTTAITATNSALATTNANVATNTSDIASQGSTLASHTATLSTHTSQIATNTSNIATNAANIATNTTNITSNTNAITALKGEMVNVQDYGANPGNTGDQAAAINSAIAALPAAGGIIFFPPGQYRLGGSTTITLPANVTLLGAGPGASAITIGSSFSGAQAVNVTGINAQLRDITIRGTSSSVATNPVAEGVVSVNNQNFKVINCAFQWINGYAIRAYGDTSDTSTGGTTLHGGALVDNRIEACAGGVWIRTTNPGALSIPPANFQIVDLFTRFLGLNSGSNANLDGVRIEDSGDVLVQNCFAWMNATTGGTGVAFRVIGKCAAIFVQNLDGLGPQTGSANVSIESNGNGDPQNVQIQGGVIQQGNIGITVAGASNQIRVRNVRILNNQTHNVSVTSTGFGIYFDECLLSGGGQVGTGTNYDISWSGTSEGFITDCRFGSSIVTSGSGAGVQGVINIAAGTVVRVDNANFANSGITAATRYPTQYPQFSSRFESTNTEFGGSVDVKLNSGDRWSFRPTTSGSNAIAMNVLGTDSNDRFRILGSGQHEWGTGSAARDTTWTRQGVAQIGTPDSDIVVGLAGKTLVIKNGTNAKAGTVTANGTTAVTVSTTAVTVNSTVVLSYKSGSGNTSAPYVSALTAGTSFAIKSNAGDTATYNWIILEQA